MRANRMRLLLLALALLLGACIVSPAQAGGQTPSKTIANLKAAYRGETEAHAKYQAYAHVAGREGYRAVAQLFRAASISEAVHARNDKAALAHLGVFNAARGSYDQRPGTTRANLEESLKDETEERDSIYPRMIDEARQEGQPGAARAIHYAVSAEAQHAELFQQALDHLSTATRPVGYYVCPVCGATYTTKNVPGVSPVCGTPKSHFIRVQ